MCCSLYAVHAQGGIIGETCSCADFSRNRETKRSEHGENASKHVRTIDQKKVDVSAFHRGSVHETYHCQRRDEKSRSQSSGRQTMGQISELVSLELHARRPKDRSGSTGEHARIVVRVASLMFCSLHEACRIVQDMLRSTEEELCSGEDNVQGDGYTAVFTEQGATASQVQTAALLETISRLPGMAEKQTTQSQWVHVRSSRVAEIT